MKPKPYIQIVKTDLDEFLRTCEVAVKHGYSPMFPTTTVLTTAKQPALGPPPTPTTTYMVWMAFSHSGFNHADFPEAFQDK